MTKKDVNQLISYWTVSAGHDWKTFLGCLKTRNYVGAMFFLHLFFEKKIKGLIVKATREQAPFGHGLGYLCGKLPFDVPGSILRDFEELTKFNLVARYPDEKLLIYKQVNLKYVETWKKRAEKLNTWLDAQLKA